MQRFSTLAEAQRADKGTIFFDTQKALYVTTTEPDRLPDGGITFLEPVQPDRPATLCWTAKYDPRFNPNVSAPELFTHAHEYFQKFVGTQLPAPQFTERPGGVYEARYPGVVVASIQPIWNALYNQLEQEKPASLRIQRPDAHGVVRSGWLFDCTADFVSKHGAQLIHRPDAAVNCVAPAAADPPPIAYQPKLFTRDAPLSGKVYTGAADALLLKSEPVHSVTPLYSTEEDIGMPRAVRIVFQNDTFCDVGCEGRCLTPTHHIACGARELYDFLTLFWSPNRWVEALNQRYIHVGGDEVFHVYRDARGEQVILEFKDSAFKKHLKGHCYPAWVIPKNKKSEPTCELKDVADLWLTNLTRRRAKTITFDPQRPPGLTNELYNLYQGFGVEPKAPPSGRLDDAAPLMRAHIRDVLCGGDDVYYAFFLDDLAATVQRPHVKQGVVHVFKGAQGCGKNVITNALVRLFGAHGTEITHQGQITGHFNHHLFNMILTVLNEAVWGGDKAGEGVLKALITEERTMYEFKCKNAISGFSYHFFIVNSNERWCVPVEPGDRRFSIYPVSNHRKGDATYFSALHRAIDEGELQELLWYLQRRVVPADWRAADHMPPRNRAFVDQIVQDHRQALLKFLLDQMEHEGGWFPFIQKDKPDGVKARSDAVRVALQREAREIPGMDAVTKTPNSVTSHLREILGECFMSRAQIEKTHCYWFASAEAVQRRLAEYVKCPSYFSLEQEPDAKRAKDGDAQPAENP